MAEPPSGVVGLTRAAEAPWSDHRSGMLIQLGVSAARTGSRNVFMTWQRIPPGMRCTPHFYINCETAMFVLAGPVVMRYGPALEHEHRAETGDFLHVPENAVHQIINPSGDAEAEVVLCRDAAEELAQEVEID